METYIIAGGALAIVIALLCVYYVKHEEKHKQFIHKHTKDNQHKDDPL